MKNKYEIRGDVTVVFVERKGIDYEVLIDTEDFVLVNSFPNKWGTNETKGLIYADGKVNLNGKRVLVRMHRLIMNTPDGLVVDHINHKTLDNRKINLRNVSHQVNQQNLNGFRSSNNSKVYRGVTWNEDHQKWNALIYARGKPIYIGRFEDQEEAINRVKICENIINEFGDDFTHDMIKDYLVDKNKPRKNNLTSKIKNVYPTKNGWYVQISHGNKRYRVGHYKDISEAGKIADYYRKNKHLL